MAGLQGQRRRIRETGKDVGGASRDVIFQVFALAILGIYFVEHALRAAIVESDGGIAAPRTFFRVLADLLRAKSLGIESSFKNIVDAVETADKTGRIGDAGDAFLAMRAALHTQRRRAGIQQPPLRTVAISDAYRQVMPCRRRLNAHRRGHSGSRWRARRGRILRISRERYEQ